MKLPTIKRMEQMLRQFLESEIPAPKGLDAKIVEKIMSDANYRDLFFDEKENARCLLAKCKKLAGELDVQRKALSIGAGNEIEIAKEVERLRSSLGTCTEVTSRLLEYIRDHNDKQMPDGITNLIQHHGLTELLPALDGKGGE